MIKNKPSDAVISKLPLHKRIALGQAVGKKAIACDCTVKKGMKIKS